MQNISIRFLWFIFIAIIMLNPSEYIFGQQKKFKVVIDAGHGGHDSGTTGTGKRKKREKDIALAVALLVDKKLKKYTDIKPILTRKKDVFVELYERAAIANRNKADLFISIHCNANKNSRANGSETFVLGIHRNKDNLNVAKRENSVIKLEKDNKLHYEGFDAEHPESFIGLTLVQEAFLDQSIMMASLIQQEFGKSLKNIKDRSVQQAGFAVLRLTYMPSVLSEIGFLSNDKEEKFLNTKVGQDKIAIAIANAIVKYKKSIYNNTPNASQITHKTDKEDVNKYETKIYPDITFKVQLMATRKKISLDNKIFKGLKNIRMLKIGMWYKYFAGSTSDYNEIVRIKHKAHQKSFKQAYIVAYKGKQRMTLSKILHKK